MREIEQIAASFFVSLLSKTDRYFEPKNTQRNWLPISGYFQNYGQSKQNAITFDFRAFYMLFQLKSWYFELLVTHSGRNICINFRSKKRFILHINPHEKYNELRLFSKYLAEPCVFEVFEVKGHIIFLTEIFEASLGQNK